MIVIALGAIGIIVTLGAVAGWVSGHLDPPRTPTPAPTSRVTATFPVAPATLATAVRAAAGTLTGATLSRIDADGTLVLAVRRPEGADPEVTDLFVRIRIESATGGSAYVAVGEPRSGGAPAEVTHRSLVAFERDLRGALATAEDVVADDDGATTL